MPDPGETRVRSAGTNGSGPTRQAIDKIFDLVAEGLAATLRSSAVEYANRFARAVSKDASYSVVRAPFDAAANAVLKLGECTRHEAEVVARNAARAAGAPGWLVTIAGAIAAKIVTKPVENPLHLAALALRSTGWILEIQLARSCTHRDVLEQVEIDVAVGGERAHEDVWDAVKELLVKVEPTDWRAVCDLLFKLDPVDWRAVRDLLYKLDPTDWHMLRNVVTGPHEQSSQEVEPRPRAPRVRHVTEATENREPGRQRPQQRTPPRQPNPLAPAPDRRPRASDRPSGPRGLPRSDPQPGRRAAGRRRGRPTGLSSPGSTRSAALTPPGSTRSAALTPPGSTRSAALIPPDADGCLGNSHPPLAQWGDEAPPLDGLEGDAASVEFDASDEPPLELDDDDPPLELDDDDDPPLELSIDI